MTANLLDFCERPKDRKKENQKPSSALPKPPLSIEKSEQKLKPDQKSIKYADFPEDLPPSYLVSVFYDGKKQLSTVKLYEPISKKIYFWDDNTGHKPYLLTSL
ncbi:MAG: hypothetical protein P8X91_03720, partial [Candidatus Bathyarchaeota archaeon]